MGPHAHPRPNEPCRSRRRRLVRGACRCPRRTKHSRRCCPVAYSRLESPAREVLQQSLRCLPPLQGLALKSRSRIPAQCIVRHQLPPMLFPVHSAPRATDVSLPSTTARLRALCRRDRMCLARVPCRGLTCMIRSCSSQSLVPESLLRHFHAPKHSTHLPIPACRWLLRWCRGQPLLVRRHHEVGLPRCAPLRSRHLKPTALRKG